MAGEGDLIDFNIIEGHKENIQALPSGRSAKALAQLYSPPLLSAQPSPGLQTEAQLNARAGFEKELANIEDSDDPLDVYDRYVKWTLDTFPSSQATAQSQLLPLLERATKAFQTSSHYRNDSRYLKIWLHYIRLFSDAPRSVFIFLARNGIGEELALYYEEFAAWLENAGRWAQAEEIYRLGLEKEARPAERLTRKFGEFERRKDAIPQDAAEPSSPALPIARPALAAKLDPFSAASPSATQSQGNGSGTKKPKSKMAIFSDKEAPAEPALGTGSKSWDSIGTLSQRRKENYVEPKPMAGEKLQVGKTNGGVQKMMVFRDQSSNRIFMPRHVLQTVSKNCHALQSVFNEKTGRLECVFVDLEAIYPDVENSSVEYSFEEVRARRRGLVHKDGQVKLGVLRSKASANRKSSGRMNDMDSSEDVSQRHEPSSEKKNRDVRMKEKAFEIFQDDSEPITDAHLDNRDTVPVKAFSKTLVVNDENDENKPPSRDELAAAKKARREERANRTRKIKVMDIQHISNETKTIQLNMDSPPKSKIRRKKSLGVTEPTMTINTKEAMDEIYGIFSAPLPSHEEPQEDEDDSTSGSDDDDDYTTGDESTATGKLSAPASEYGDETRNELLGAQRSAQDEDRTDVSGWSDFTLHKSKEGNVDDEPVSNSVPLLETSTATQDQQHQQEELLTPIDDEEPKTRYVPVPPEDYEPQTAQYRDLAIIPNHRLPFMTPIVERTESSLGVATARTEKDYFGTKTPSRNVGTPEPIGDDDEEPCSSPFQDITADLAEDKRRVLQPIRTKSTKGTIALGQGTAKSQTAKMDETPIDEPATKGPIVKEAQCNPMDPLLRQNILSQMRPPLSSFEGYHEDLATSCGRTAEIKKYTRTLSKASRSSVNLEKTGQALSTPPVIDLPRSQGTYTIRRELGAGTFAPVYLAENNAAAAIDASNDDEENAPFAKIGKLAHRRPLEAIKMEEPPSTWEFYMIRQSHRRLGISRAAESIVRAHEMHLYQDECFLVEEFRDQGTLLDLVNIARLESGSGGGMDEMLAMWFTIELLRVVEALHSKQLIHGDLKGDNILVRFDDPGVETDWSPTYFPSGAHGWSSKGVCLIDFGRGIDMKHFVPNVGFIADWKTSEADCAEMRELRPWTYQIDYHGLAGIVHSLLFGKYMESVGEKSGSLGQGANKTYRIRETLKRYWQTELWSDLFQLLLNPIAHVEAEEGKKLPMIKSMRSCRERMEGWLEENCDRGVGLKGMISRLEGAIREKRKKTMKSSQS